MVKHTAEKCRKMEIRKDEGETDSQQKKNSFANNNEKKKIQPQHKVVRVCV